MGMVGRRKASMIRFESGAGFALCFPGELWKFSESTETFHRFVDGGTSGLPLVFNRFFSRAESLPPYLNSFSLALCGDSVPHLQMQSDMTTSDSNENQELLNLIGDDAFTRLCTVFGGTRLYVSNSDGSRKRLTIIVGEENAKNMIFHFDGVKLTLPMLSSLEIKKRHQAVIEDAKKGMSQRDIAMKYDLTERNVRRIISDA